MRSIRDAKAAHIGAKLLDFFKHSAERGTGTATRSTGPKPIQLRSVRAARPARSGERSQINVGVDLFGRLVRPIHYDVAGALFADTGNRGELVHRGVVEIQ